MAHVDERIVKVLLPAGLVRRLDLALQSQWGGFETRAEFIREACENMLVELEHAAGATPSKAHDDSGQPVGLVHADLHPSIDEDERRVVTVTTLSETALPAGVESFVLSDGVVEPPAGPLLGLHNRDFPTLWAASRLAAYSPNGPIAWTEFVDRVTGAAWLLGAALRQLQDHSEQRVTALFPVNLAKRQAAERNFQQFALGSLPKRAEGPLVKAAGPLFSWQVCQLVRAGGIVNVGLTPQGLRLLHGLAGLSVEYPHAPAHAVTFLAHLAEYAPDDRWGLDFVVRLVSGGPSRSDLVDAFLQHDSAWTPAMASSFAQGYVARAREWGLVEPTLIDGRYSLTPFGQQMLDIASNGERS